MSQRPASVTADIELRLVVPGSAALPVLASLTFEADDPYAVHVAFHTGGDRGQVQWSFARQLLTDGVTQPVGEGDVRVWPTSEAGQALVTLSLSSPSGAALFEVPLADIVEFLTRSYAAVPTGSESDFVDLDAELALLMWSDEDGPGLI
jgi:hypothetical protein